MDRNNPFAIEVTPTITDLLAAHAPVAIGTSGGKDSSAAALATYAYLDQIGHRGPRLLIHSDLGRVEWKDSLPTCQRLADRLGLELVVVKRNAGDLMDRWQIRWDNNLARYAALQCVKMILPWSTASMRFCTSELKTAIICRALTERFAGQTILSVVGLRRQESPMRAKAPICAAQLRLTSKTFATQGYSWHPILSWSQEDVFAYHERSGFPLHEAYTRYGTTRVSCCFCILGSHADQLASAACRENQDIYREMVELEIVSTFRFQEARWLGDLAPHLLTGDMPNRLAETKRRAVLRERIEARIPKQLLYVKGWPTRMPTKAEATLLSEVRREVAAIMGIAIHYTEPGAILERYAELMEMNTLRAYHRERAPVSAEIIQQQLWDEDTIA